MTATLDTITHISTTHSDCMATSMTSHRPSSKQRSMLHNTPTNWLESNNPSLYRSQGDSVPSISSCRTLTSMLSR